MRLPHHSFLLRLLELLLLLIVGGCAADDVSSNSLRTVPICRQHQDFAPATFSVSVPQLLVDPPSSSLAYIFVYRPIVATLHLRMWVDYQLQDQGSTPMRRFADGDGIVVILSDEKGTLPTSFVVVIEKPSHVDDVAPFTFYSYVTRSTQSSSASPLGPIGFSDGQFCAVAFSETQSLTAIAPFVQGLPTSIYAQSPLPSERTEGSSVIAAKFTFLASSSCLTAVAVSKENNWNVQGSQQQSGSFLVDVQPSTKVLLVRIVASDTCTTRDAFRLSVRWVRQQQRVGQAPPDTALLPLSSQSSSTPAPPPLVAAVAEAETRPAEGAALGLFASILVVVVLYFIAGSAYNFSHGATRFPDFLPHHEKLTALLRNAWFFLLRLIQRILGANASSPPHRPGYGVV